MVAKFYISANLYADKNIFVFYLSTFLFKVFYAEHVTYFSEFGYSKVGARLNKLCQKDTAMFLMLRFECRNVLSKRGDSFTRSSESLGPV